MRVLPHPRNLTTPPHQHTKQQEIDLPAREGAYVTGLSLQGARWDAQAGT